jgi:cellulose biosynthesis protein BcsQ
MIIISIANQKGGGQNNNALNLAHGLAIENNKVILIDVDLRQIAPVFF